MPRHPVTVAVAIAATGFSAVLIAGLQPAATASYDDGPLTCAGDRVTIHHIDHGDRVVGGPLDPVTALDEYVRGRGVPFAEFTPLKVYADAVYYGSEDGNGDVVAVASLRRFGTSWRVAEFEACSDVLADGGVR